MQIMIAIDAIQRILNASFWGAKGFYIIKKGVGLSVVVRGGERSEEKNQKKGSKKRFKEKKK